MRMQIKKVEMKLVTAELKVDYYTVYYLTFYT